MTKKAKGLRPADYLSYYAQHFDTVEIDSTFYATPNVSVVRSWNAKTPEGFLFAPAIELFEDSFNISFLVLGPPAIPSFARY
jgi:hypothetical protein